MSRALFVSDIHIQSPGDARAEMFLRLLEACPRLGVTHLFLVGDIFDFWIADRDYFVRRYTSIIEAIRKLSGSGIAVHFFEGNHDLDLSPFWQKHVGTQVHAEAAFFNLNGLKFRVEHGDQMDLTDHGYLFLRWLLRTPVVVFLARTLPNWMVRLIGERASRASRNYTTHLKVASEMRTRQVIQDHAVRLFALEDFDVIVSGHVHVEEDRWLEIDRRRVRLVNLGTWLKTPFVLDSSSKGLALRKLDELLSE